MTGGPASTPLEKALAVIAGIPRDEWIDLGYAMLVPAVMIVGAPLLLSLRP
jgi:hypothetical protein